MLESLFIILLVIGIILFILGVYDDAIAFYGISLIIFLVLIGASFNIEQKVIIATNATNYSVRTIKTIDYSINSFLVVFVFLDIIMLLLHWFHRKKMKRGDIPYVPPGMQ